MQEAQSDIEVNITVNVTVNPMVQVSGGVYGGINNQSVLQGVSAVAGTTSPAETRITSNPTVNVTGSVNGGINHNGAVFRTDSAGVPCNFNGPTPLVDVSGGVYGGINNQSTLQGVSAIAGNGSSSQMHVTSNPTVNVSGDVRGGINNNGAVSQTDSVVSASSTVPGDVMESLVSQSMSKVQKTKAYQKSSSGVKKYRDAESA